VSAKKQAENNEERDGEEIRERGRKIGGRREEEKKIRKKKEKSYKEVDAWGGEIR